MALEQVYDGLQRLRSWFEELLLRGTAQLALKDIEWLEREAEEAARLQMDFLSTLLKQVASEGRKMVLGGGEEQQLLLHSSRLYQYVQLAEQK
ncbi:hypothetical protein [Paenibacillus sp. FSL H8-0537]|uniref:hypothetical protein n=1 Tax=Paenibacillus sp. FSL H8-0537 TaxID=2921399 RepID=UPI0031013D36